MDQLSNPSGYETQPAAPGGPSVLPDTAGKFIKCGHTLHLLCMLAMYNNGTKVRAPGHGSSARIAGSASTRRGVTGSPRAGGCLPQDGSLQCPSCKTIYGEKTGAQPKGKMEIYSIGQSLPGHPDCGTIQIIYSIPPGLQVGPQLHTTHNYTLHTTHYTLHTAHYAVLHRKSNLRQEERSLS